MTNTQTLTKTSPWTIDPVHSVVGFAVKHMMVATVRGNFERFEGTLRIDEEHPENSTVEATVYTASVNTNQEQRDNHLRSADFFDAERYPTMTFRSTKVELLDETHARVTGDLTIRDVTRPVVFDVEYGGQIKDAYGKQRAAFDAETKISRKEFGLTYNPLLESGGAVVGDEVRITLNIAAVRQD